MTGDPEGIETSNPNPRLIDYPVHGFVTTRKLIICKANGASYVVNYDITLNLLQAPFNSGS